MALIATMKFDGGSRGNPGPAASAYVLNVRKADLSDGQRNRIIPHGTFIGIATNNVAEYKALITGVERAVQEGIRELHIFGDSKLVICQINSEWRCKSPDLRPLLEQARSALSAVPIWTAQHVRRNLNTEADLLVNRTLDLFS